MKEFAYNGGIIRNADYRGRRYDRGSMRFCSVLASNLSEMSVESEGNLAGNGWIRCNFCGSRYAGFLLDREQYDRCSMGGIRIERTQCRRLRVQRCGFAGSVLSEVGLYGCTFCNCNFRQMRLEKVVLEDTIFSGCVFERLDFSQVSASGLIFRECIFYGRMPETGVGYTLQNCMFGC